MALHDTWSVAEDVFEIVWSGNGRKKNIGTNMKILLKENSVDEF